MLQEAARLLFYSTSNARNERDTVEIENMVSFGWTWMDQAPRPKGKCQAGHTVTAVIMDLEGRSPKRMSSDQEQEQRVALKKEDRRIQESKPHVFVLWTIS